MSKQFPHPHFKDFWKTKLVPRRSLAVEQAFLYFSYIACLSFVLAFGQVWDEVLGRWVLLNFLLCVFLAEILLRLPSSDKLSDAFSKTSWITFLPTIGLAVLVDYLRRGVYIYFAAGSYRAAESPLYETALPFELMSTVRLSSSSYIILLISFFVAYHYYTKERSLLQRVVFALFLSAFILSFGGA